MQKILRIDSSDNLIVALKDLRAGESYDWNGERFTLVTDVKAKHKFATENVPVDGVVSMYGTPVGKATRPIAKGEAITVDNIRHHAAPVSLENVEPYSWQAPDVSEWESRTFKGYVRDDGRVGTASYWLVFPLVFCENRNVTKLTDALNEALGYSNSSLKNFALSLTSGSAAPAEAPKMFPHIEGVRCITVTSGCGGATSDCETMCDVLAAYADHPNVIGMTVFSL